MSFQHWQLRALTSRVSDKFGPCLSGQLPYEERDAWYTKRRLLQDREVPEFFASGRVLQHGKNDEHPAWYCVPSSVSQTNLPSATKAKQVFFKPGRIGLGADWNSGLVTSVADGGQAKRVGVRAGMRILSVASKPFSENAMDAAMVGSSDYEVLLQPEANADTEALLGAWVYWHHGDRREYQIQLDDDGNLLFVQNGMEGSLTKTQYDGIHWLMAELPSGTLRLRYRKGNVYSTFKRDGQTQWAPAIEALKFEALPRCPKGHLLEAVILRSWDYERFCDVCGREGVASPWTSSSHFYRCGQKECEQGNSASSNASAIGHQECQQCVRNQVGEDAFNPFHYVRPGQKLENQSEDEFSWLEQADCEGYCWNNVLTYAEGPQQDSKTYFLASADMWNRSRLRCHTVRWHESSLCWSAKPKT